MLRKENRQESSVAGMDARLCHPVGSTLAMPGIQHS